jgi:hypothetical protein
MAITPTTIAELQLLIENRFGDAVIEKLQVDDPEPRVFLRTMVGITITSAGKDEAAAVADLWGTVLRLNDETPAA